MRIFKDNFGVQFSAQKRLLYYNAVYIKHTLKPLLFMILPVAFIVMQMDSWYAHQPLKPGQSTIVSIKLQDKAGMKLLSNISVEANKGLKVETPPLRIIETGEINFRLRADDFGTHRISIKTPGQTFQKDVVVSDASLVRVLPQSVNASLWQYVLYPGVEPIFNIPTFEKVSIRYPSVSVQILAWRIHWLILFFVFTTVAAFLLKGFFRVHL